MSDAPLLLLDAARIDAGGAVLLDGVSCGSSAPELGLVGAWSPLFALLGGQATLASGRAEIGGAPARLAASSGRVGLAPRSAARPPAWEVRRWLAYAARLAGVPARGARAEVSRALEELGLTALAARPCSSLTPFERRACSLAEAALGAPPVLAVEAPLAGLDEPAEQAMLAVLERARARHRLIVSVETAPATGAAKNLLDALGEVIVLQAGRVVAEGSAETALGRAPRYLVRVTRHAAAFAAALAERGFAPTRASPDGARLVVEVGAAGDPSALVEVALELGAPIVELAPLAPA